MNGVGRVAIAALLTVVVPNIASAHGRLKSSVPSNGARLTVAPRELRLVFTESPELAFTTVQLLAPGGAVVDLGPVRIAADSRRAVVAAIRGPLTAGTYTVVWKMAGADGHPTGDRFSFTLWSGVEGLGSPADTVLPNVRTPAGEPGGAVRAPGQAPVPSEHHNPSLLPTGSGIDAESPAYVAIRWVQFTALIILLGTVAFNHVVLGFLLRKRPSDSPMLSPAADRAASLGLWAAVVMGVATVLRLFAQSYAMHGASDALNSGLVVTMLAKTLWGWGWLLQAVGVTLAFAGYRTARRRTRSGWTIAAIGVVALAFTPALSGHAASAPALTGLAVLADGAHVIGAGGWLGSLLAVLLAGLPSAAHLTNEERGPAIADLFNAFSPTALVFAGIAAATGVFAAWLHLGTLPALWRTTYGLTLLLKLGVLSLVAASGAYNWLRVKPTLGTEEAGRRIGRSAKVELAVGAVVLLVTAVLVATPTAMDVRAVSAEVDNTSRH
jgi:putative copper export protein/methionine-rich copper-binding protein CopC